MGRAGRPTVAVVLTDQERQTLQRWARRLACGLWRTRYLTGRS
jgi:hypothetical protein